MTLERLARASDIGLKVAGMAALWGGLMLLMLFVFGVWQP